MLEASEEFKAAMEGGRILLKADLNLADGTLIALDSESFMMGKASFTSASSSTNRFDIGAAVIGRFEFTLRNDERELDDYDFTGATIVPMLGAELSNGEVEWLQKGVYRIEQPEAYSDVVNFSALDNLSLFEKKYGEAVGAFIILQEGAEMTAEDVQEFCRGKIARYKIPKYVFFIDQFPLTGSGKIQKFKLKEMSLELCKQQGIEVI